MQIMTILGSPRKEGNTAQVLSWIEEHIQDVGHQVDHADIVDFRVEGCRECWACRESLDDYCEVRDDAVQLFERMIAADAVLLASPVFCWGFPSQLKALIDRMYCLVEELRGKPDFGLLILDKPLGLLVTTAGPALGNADLLIRGFDNLVQFTTARGAGNLVVPLCRGPQSLDHSVRHQATEFARRLVASAAVHG